MPRVLVAFSEWCPGFEVRKVLAVWVRRISTGFFDSDVHDEAVSTSAEDDRVWVGWRGVAGWGGAGESRNPTHAAMRLCGMVRDPTKR